MYNTVVVDISSQYLMSIIIPPHWDCLERVFQQLRKFLQPDKLTPKFAGYSPGRPSPFPQPSFPSKREGPPTRGHVIYSFLPLLDRLGILFRGELASLGGDPPTTGGCPVADEYPPMSVLF